MPVVLTDKTNAVWCTEQPDDGMLHAGFTGQRGPRVQDLLEFAASKEKQFKSFLEKKIKVKVGGSATKRNLLRGTKDTGNNSIRKEKSNS